MTKEEMVKLAIEACKAQRGNKLEAFQAKYGHPGNSVMIEKFWNAPTWWNPAVTAREEWENIKDHESKYNETILWLSEQY